MGIAIYKALIKSAVFITLTIFSLIGHTEETYLQINGASIHSKPGYNGFNPGLGIEHEVSENWNVAAGWYYNSNNKGTAYAYGRYAYFKSGNWDLGVGLGAGTGYEKWPVMPIAFPEFCYSYLCAIVLPQLEKTGATVIAIHARVPFEIFNSRK